MLCVDVPSVNTDERRGRDGEYKKEKKQLCLRRSAPHGSVVLTLYIDICWNLQLFLFPSTDSMAESHQRTTRTISDILPLTNGRYRLLGLNSMDQCPGDSRPNDRSSSSSMLTIFVNQNSLKNVQFFFLLFFIN
ncbi:hypothetical protein FKM82_011286 [Ascaphus truei]